MAKYLTNKETQATLEKIIINAGKKLILISPYLKLTNTLRSRIKATAEKGVEVKIVYRKNKVDKDELDKLRAIKNIELKSTDDLHAKCYFNEKEMIITSLNLLETSEKNWEMGILINRTDDKEIFDTALRDCLTIFSDSYSLPIPETKSHFKKTASKFSEPSKGYCIRCEGRIRFDASKPYCPDCYSEWDFWGNESYTESVCHSCGNEEPTIRLKPMCYDCYKKHN